MVDHSHWEFDVIREQWFDIIKGENFVFENNTLNEDMLNAKQIENNKKWLKFWSNFFNLLVYRVYRESAKKTYLRVNSQGTSELINS